MSKIKEFLKGIVSNYKNSFKQYTATNISKDGKNIGIVEFEVEEEKTIEKKDINNRFL